MSIDLLKHGFRVTASWQWQKMFEVSTLCFHAGLVGDRLLGHYVLPPVLTDYPRRCESTDEASVVVHAWLCSTTFCSWDSGIRKQRVSGTMGRARWTDSIACSFRWFKSLTFYVWDLRILLFILLMSVTCRSCKNEHRLDSKRFVWHPEFSSVSGNHCSDLQHPVLKLETDTLSILFNFQGAVTGKPCFRRPMFMKSFLLNVL